VLVEETIITNNYSTVIFARSNLSNSIFGLKNGANFVHIGRVLFKLAEFYIFNSEFQQKKWLLWEKSNNSKIL
jgi:hypothetical protein